MRTFSEHLDGSIARLPFIQTEMQADRLRDLLADSQNRIERGHRVLKDHRDLVAANPAHLGFALLRQAFAVECDSVGGDGGGTRQQSHDRKRGDRLSGTGFADDSERLAGVKRERESVDGGNGAVFGSEDGTKIADLEKRH